MCYIKQKLLVIKNKNKEERWKLQLFGKPKKFTQRRRTKEAFTTY